MASHVAPFPEGGWLAQYGPPALAQLLQVLLFRSSSALLLVDDQGVCRDASGGAARLLALPRPHIVGQKLTLVSLSPAGAESASEPFSFTVTGADGGAREVPCRRRPTVLPGRHLLVLDDRRISPHPPSHALAVTDFACYLLDKDGCFFQWNGGARRLYGFQASEVAGLSLALLHPAGTGAPETHRLLDRMAGGNAIVEEGWNRRRDHSRFWANVIATPLLGSTGERMGFAAIARDFDQRRSLQTNTPRDSGFPLNPEQKVAAIASGECDQIRTANDGKGVVTLAATRLGLHRTTLNAIMRKLGISRKDI